MSKGKRRNQQRQTHHPAPLAPVPSPLGAVQTHFVAQTYSGPLPSPQDLEQYEKLVKGSAKLLFRMADRQSKHRQALELLVVNSDIQRSWYGLMVGGGLALLLTLTGGFLVYMGHDTAGATIATGTIVSLAGVFIYGTQRRQQERAEVRQVAPRKK